MAKHRQELRIYLEDTDAQGVVYHANYLKYCERSRTDILMQQGFRLADLQKRGWTLVVHEMRLRFLRPARLHDDVAVVTSAKRSSEFRITFTHEVFRGSEEKPLFTAVADVVAISPDGALIGIPDEILTEAVG